MCVTVLLFRLLSVWIYYDASSWMYSLMKSKSELIHLMAAVRGLTCASAWQMRSLASRVKCCTLGSVFITASYLLTASSYLKEQEAGRCLSNTVDTAERNMDHCTHKHHATLVIPSVQSCECDVSCMSNVMRHPFTSRQDLHACL